MFLKNITTRTTRLGASLLVLIAVGIPGCGGGGGGTGSGKTQTKTSLSSITLTPSPATVPYGLTIAFTANGVYDDGSSADITSQVIWSSGDTTVATVNGTTGVATSVKLGTANITALASDGINATAALTVTAATIKAISIAPSNPSTFKGMPVTFVATGTFTDGTTGNVSNSVTWASSNTDVATINASGIASSLVEGTTTITATANGHTSNSVTLTVLAPYMATIGGTVSGLTAASGVTPSITLSDGTDNKTLLADGSFTFPTQLPTGTAYSLSIVTLSANRICTSTYGAGIVTDANVTNMNVICGVAGGPSAFTATTSLAIARTEHTATRLNTGNVLVVGGWDSTWSLLNSAALYDPTAGTWTAKDNLITGRSNHTATLLPNGKVLVVGGVTIVGLARTNLSSAEIYDPATGTWSTTGSLATPRSYHTATLLPNGKVLVAGGDGSASGGMSTSLSSAEIYDPATGLWSTTSSLATARSIHSATLLPNGKVVVVGGGGGGVMLASAELFDPATGLWTGAGNLGTARAWHTATLLPNGRVLIAGGIANGAAPFSSSSEIYDPVAGTFTTTAGSLATGRSNHTATLLPSGKVLVGGGRIDGGTVTTFTASTELFDPVTGMWTASGISGTPRQYHTATLLLNGKLLVVGGDGWGTVGSPPVSVSIPFSISELYW